MNFLVSILLIVCCVFALPTDISNQDLLLREVEYRIALRVRQPTKSVTTSAATFGFLYASTYFVTLATSRLLRRTCVENELASIRARILSRNLTKYADSLEYVEEEMDSWNKMGVTSSLASVPGSHGRMISSLYAKWLDMHPHPETVPSPNARYLIEMETTLRFALDEARRPTNADLLRNLLGVLRSYGWTLNFNGPASVFNAPLIMHLNESLHRLQMIMLSNGIGIKSVSIDQVRMRFEEEAVNTVDAIINAISVEVNPLELHGEEMERGVTEVPPEYRSAYTLPLSL